LAEDSILVEYEPEVSPEINRKTHRLAYALERKGISGLVTVAPAYRSLIVYYDPFRLHLNDLKEAVLERAAHLEAVIPPPPQLFRIPAVYGGKHGADLERVSHHSGLESGEVVRLFSNQILNVYCLGFTCSLAYLGGVPEAIHTPRLETPRSLLPAGSLGFAGPQANILPVDTPSGFNYIGRVFVSVYDPQRFPPTPIRPGDLVICPAVSEAEARSSGKRPLENFIAELADS
jgi:KipI family sensor histidine kinase inhibitor